MNNTEKWRQLERLFEGKERAAVMLADSVLTLSTERGELNIPITEDWNVLLFKINDFLFSKKVPPVGNFGEFSKAKLTKLLEERTDLEMSLDGSVDLVNLNTTIKINYFHPLQSIIDNINKSILDANKHYKAKIKPIKL